MTLVFFSLLPKNEVGHFQWHLSPPSPPRNIIALHESRIAFQSRMDLISFVRQSEIWKRSDLLEAYNALEKDLVALPHSQSPWKTLIPPSTANYSTHHWGKGCSKEMRGGSAGFGIRGWSPIQVLPFLSTTPAWACLSQSLLLSSL